jgi:hypothetical protein
MRCGNAEATGMNQCLVQYEATRDEVLEGFSGFKEGFDGCVDLISTSNAGELGCLPVGMSTVGYGSNDCEFYC